MANKFTYQTLRDTNTEAIIKLTGTFDGSGQESNVGRIVANTLSGALDANGVPLYTRLSTSNTTLGYYDLQLTGMKYYVNFPTQNVGGVEVFWTGGGSNAVNQYANAATIFHLNGQGEFGLGEQLPAILNNSSGANTRGDIGIQTQGAIANSAYTLILSFRKNNNMYSRGQFSDPAAFNYGPYALKP
jgi:hypothetical protein